jgi:predicted transcriptional regulator
MAIKKQPGKPSRKQRFLAALDIAGLTQESWAAREGITYQHLYMVLKGERESQSLMDRIDAFVIEQLRAASDTVAA